MRAAPVLGYVVLALGTLFAIHETMQTADEAHRAAIQVKKADARSAATARTARDQVCRVFESEHLREVQQLKRTYAYLDEVIQREETGLTLNQFILQGMANLEIQARSDRAPAFCDAPKVGLSEPDPVLPKKRDFSKYIKR